MNDDQAYEFLLEDSGKKYPRTNRRNKSKKEKRNSQKEESVSLRLNEIYPKTENQHIAFAAYRDFHLMLHGYAGTGKTMISMYLGLNDVLENNSEKTKIVIVRSVVPTRDMGFLPGSQAEKMAVYEAPYKDICKRLFGRSDAYELCKKKGLIEFMSTSFIRGITLSDCIVIVDEMQNLDGGELDSIITRIGENCKIIMCGDYKQTDFDHFTEKEGLKKFMKVIRSMRKFKFIEFGKEDILRSDIVKDYILEKDRQKVEF